MSLKRAQAEGFDALSVFVVQFDRAHFYPDKDLVYLELVVEKRERKDLRDPGAREHESQYVCPGRCGCGYPQIQAYDC